MLFPPVETWMRRLEEAGQTTLYAHAWLHRLAIAAEFLEQDSTVEDRLRFAAVLRRRV